MALSSSDGFICGRSKRAVNATNGGTEATALAELKLPFCLASLSISVSCACESFTLLDWMAHFKQAPKHTFVVHGEPLGAQALADAIHQRLGWTQPIVPEPGLGYEIP